MVLFAIIQESQCLSGMHDFLPFYVLFLLPSLGVDNFWNVN